jgi:hypothetical protein
MDDGPHTIGNSLRLYSAHGCGFVRDAGVRAVVFGEVGEDPELIMPRSGIPRLFRPSISFYFIVTGIMVMM